MQNCYGFLVHLNGEKVGKGIIPKESYVVSCIIMALHRQDGSESVSYQLSGLDVDANLHLEWGSKEISLGDRISLEVIESPMEPSEINSVRTAKSESFSDEDLLKQKINQYYSLKAELKEHI